MLASFAALVRLKGLKYKFLQSFKFNMAAVNFTECKCWLLAWNINKHLLNHVLAFSQIDSVELWEAQSKNPGPLEYTLSQGSPAFAEELQAHDLVFRTNEGRVTEVLSHPQEPSHVLNVKRGILSAMQVQFVEYHATLEEVSII